ncbi:MAG: BglG family transcription antiterminator, partial [Faecalibacillus sp.]
LEKELKSYHIQIVYKDYYYIREYNIQTVNLMNKFITQFLYLFENQNKSFNDYESLVMKIIMDAYFKVSIKNVVLWTNRCCNQYNSQLNDDEYKMYVSLNVVFVWFVLHHVDFPENMGFVLSDDEFVQYLPDIKELEHIINCPIKSYYRGALIRLLEYLNNEEGIYGKIDIVYIQFLIFQLLEFMSQKLNIDFTQDRMLRDGLLKYVVPLIKRLTSGFVIFYHHSNEIPQKYVYVYHSLVDCLQKIDILNQLESDDEIKALTIYFIASIRRLKETTEKNILIVCFHGYGTSTFLKEVLSHEYMVEVVDVIPNYKLSTYYIGNIDYIISTLPLEIDKDIPIITVNPILTLEDYEKLNHAGLQRRVSAMNLLHVQKKLDFLDDMNRQKVMNVIKAELGYPQDIKKVYRISDLLKEECIQVVDQMMDWQEAILDSSFILEEKGYVKGGYGKKIIQGISETGFYCVTDDYFALFHGKEGTDVYISGMSLIINRQDVFFDDKKVKVIFCLASKDKKDPIPAMILLMRMLKKTDFLDKIKKVSSSHEAYYILKSCEEEVIS